jgi:hypothetical protein
MTMATGLVPRNDASPSPVRRRSGGSGLPPWVEDAHRTRGLANELCAREDDENGPTNSTTARPITVGCTLARLVTTSRYGSSIDIDEQETH